jgi:tetratricopeptide (TPR) repeat protein
MECLGQSCVEKLQRIPKEHILSQFPLRHNLQIATFLSRVDRWKHVTLGIGGAMNPVEGVHPLMLSPIVAYNHALLLAERRKHKEALLSLKPFMEVGERTARYPILFLLLHLAALLKDPSVSHEVLKVLSQEEDQLPAQFLLPFARIEALFATVLMPEVIAQCRETKEGGMFPSSVHPHIEDVLALYEAAAYFEHEAYQKCEEILIDHLKYIQTERELVTPYHATLLNNLSCVYARQGKVSLAGLCLERALSSYHTLQKAQVSQNFLLVDASPEIYYNMGMNLRKKVFEKSMPHYYSLSNLPVAYDLQLLEHAFDCFAKSARYWKTFPYVWIRMAECCLMWCSSACEQHRRAHRCATSGGASESSTSHEECHDSDREGDDSDDGGDDEDGGDEDGESQKTADEEEGGGDMTESKKEDPTQEKTEEDEGSEEKGDKSFRPPHLFDRIVCKGQHAIFLHSVSSLQQFACRSGEDKSFNLQNAIIYYQTALRLLPKSEQAAREHVLVGLAYAHLCTEDCYGCLRYCMQALQPQPTAPYNHFLLNMYTAEALVRLNRAKEALPFLQPSKLKELALLGQSSGASEDRYQFFKARSAVYTNLATGLILLRRIGDARKANIRALEYCPYAPAALMNQAYIEIASGDVQRALVLFGDFRGMK